MFLQRALATGLMELVEALIDPSKTDQECSAILMPVPPAFIGKSYKTIYIKNILSYRL